MILYVDSEDFEDMQILEDIVSIDVIKDGQIKILKLKKLFDKYGKNAGLIFVRRRPGIDIGEGRSSDRMGKDWKVSDYLIFPQVRRLRLILLRRTRNFRLLY